MVRIKNVRLKGNDYRIGWYFVTIVANLRKKILNDHRIPIENCLKEINNINRCKIDYYVIMPDHLHLIIGLSNSELSLGEVIRRFKAKSSKIANTKLWQPNYYEHGIRAEEALNRIREYIIHNPQAELLKFESFYR